MFLFLSLICLKKSRQVGNDDFFAQNGGGHGDDDR